MSEGTLVVGELAIPVVKVALRHGTIELTAEIRGPIDLPTGGQVRVHSPDGTLVMVAPWVVDPGVAEEARTAAPHGRVTIIVPLLITTDISA